jgi:hypothetical protein
MTYYLTDTQMDELLERAKTMRKGKKLLHEVRKAYTVIVDGDHFEFATTKTLRKFLTGCKFSPDYRVFVNFDKGITINLD